MSGWGLCLSGCMLEVFGDCLQVSGPACRYLNLAAGVWLRLQISVDSPRHLQTPQGGRVKKPPKDAKSCWNSVQIEAVGDFCVCLVGIWVPLAHDRHTAPALHFLTTVRGPRTHPKKGLSKQAESTPGSGHPGPNTSASTRPPGPSRTGAARPQHQPTPEPRNLWRAHPPWVQVFSMWPMRQGFKKKRRAVGQQNPKKGRCAAGTVVKPCPLGVSGQTPPDTARHLQTPPDTSKRRHTAA